MSGDTGLDGNHTPRTVGIESGSPERPALMSWERQPRAQPPRGLSLTTSSCLWHICSTGLLYAPPVTPGLTQKAKAGKQQAFLQPNITTW